MAAPTSTSTSVTADSADKKDDMAEDIKVEREEDTAEAMEEANESDKFKMTEPTSSVTADPADKTDDMAEDMKAKGEEDAAEAMEEANESDSDSEDSDNEPEVEDNPKIRELELQLVKSPFHYDSHLQLIKLLQQSSHLHKTRKAREEMSKIFPLTEELWLSWVEDETPLASVPGQKEYIRDLFEKAVKDYQSVRVWVQYCQFEMDNMEGEAGLTIVREIFERAITSSGLHVTEGSSIWDGYIEFELAILNSLEQMNTETEKALAKLKFLKIEQAFSGVQRERVNSLYKRKLAVPLLGLQTTYDEYEAWLEDEEVPSQTVHAYMKALAKIKECSKYEQLLSTSQNPSLEDFRGYLDYELQCGLPARVQCLYERAIKIHCLIPDLWSEYTNYLDTKLKIPSIVLPVHKRSIRNCPWVSTLWQNYIRAHERMKQDPNKIKETLDQALSSGFTCAEEYLDLWVCYCDCMRREVKEWTPDDKNVKQLKETYEKAIGYMQHYFGNDGDPTCCLKRNLARIEAYYLHNLEETQKLWEETIKANNHSTDMWLEYTSLLRHLGDIKGCRKVFQRGVELTQDRTERFSQTFLDFERDTGTLEDWDRAVHKCQIQLQRTAAKQAKLERKEGAATKTIEEAAGKKKKQKAEKKPAKKAEKKAKPDLKRKAENINKNPTWEEKDKTIEPAIKKLKTQVKTDEEEGKMETNSSEVQSEATKRVLHDETKNDVTVFVSNLLFTVDEDALRKKFEPLGEIAEIRLVKNRLERSKGYGYVEFKDKSSTALALAMDREPLDGRPMFVSPYIDKTKTQTQPSFKFPTKLDKLTVFVTNLPFELSSTELEEMFKQFGSIKQVRLVTNRSGKSKGYAYVEFEEEANASKAILKLDGTLIKERTINVALSNPPSKKQHQQHQHQQQYDETLTHGGPSASHVRGKARTMISLLPRSLQRPSTAAATKSSSSQSSSTTASTLKPEPEEEKPPTDSAQATQLSNTDFREVSSGEMNEKRHENENNIAV